MKRRGFTLVELMIVIFVISTGLIVIIKGMTESHRYITETAQRTIALNLAKEGIEAVYNIRNSNWRRRSDKKDQCWLKVDPLVDEGNDGCENDQLITPGRWILQRGATEGIKLIPGWVANGDDKGASSGEHNQIVNQNSYGRRWLKSSLRYPGADKTRDPVFPDHHGPYYIHHTGSGWLSHAEFLNTSIEVKDDIKNGVYWGYVFVTGIYKKDDGALIDCRKGRESPLCRNDLAKELRFCSTVFYTQPYQGVVNICSIMTNFQK